MRWILLVAWLASAGAPAPERRAVAAPASVAGCDTVAIALT